MPVRVAVRPEEFTVHKDGEGIDAVVKSSVFLGISTHYFMETEAGQEVEVIRPSDVGTIIPNGTNVSYGWKPRASMCSPKMAPIP